VADVITELKSFSVNVEIVDPHASSEEFKEEYGYSLIKEPGKGYDAIILAVNHKEYVKLDEPYFTSLVSANGVFVDIKGIFRNKIKSLVYWSL
jgi:UDP-N-acetyl-D-galactosamine dehydrogenase